MSDHQGEDEVIEVEIDEVIAPGGATFQRRSEGAAEGRQGREVPRSPFAKLLSYVLDECIVIPGTNLRIGLDPILGLIPGGGEAVASVAGAFIIGDAYRKGVSMQVVFRMLGNLFLNAGVGAIPGIGDLFSAGFKSNSRNYRILDDFLKNPPPAGKRRRLWPLVLGIAVASLVINLAVFFLFYWAAITLWQTIG